MKLDAHVHTHYSGMTTIWPLKYIMRESYNTPQRVYRLAKARGMDLVAITDHDTINGALTLSHLPDVIVGCEISAHFPGQEVDVHLGVLDITERQFRQIDRLRSDVLELVQYLRDEAIFTTINHVASQVNGRLTPTHIAAILPYVDAFEVINGSRLHRQNRTALALAESGDDRGFDILLVRQTDGVQIGIEAKLALNPLNLLNYLARGDAQGAAVEARRFQAVREYLQSRQMSAASYFFTQLA